MMFCDANEATATTTATTNPLVGLVRSLSLTAEEWAAIKSAGACGCCAARLAGCHDPRAYKSNESDVRAQLDAHFFGGGTLLSKSVYDVHSGKDNNVIPRPCTLCLGLLQPEVPLLLAPPARPSAESRGPDERACLLPSSLSMEETVLDMDAVPNTDDDKHEAGTTTTGAGPGADHLGNRRAEEGTGQFPKKIECSTAATNAAATAAASTGNGDIPEGAAEVPPVEIPPKVLHVTKEEHRPARLAESIARCSTIRGYTVSSFAITAAVPACLAVRDAAFVVALGTLLQTVSDTARSVTAGEQREKTATTVKDALKYALAGALEVQFNAPHDNNSDFVVEITAKAPAADAHAAELLGGLAPVQSGSKPPGWPGAGRWAKKRQRREEHRFPGLTVGAVKKGLSNLTDEGRDRMRRWVEGLRARDAVDGDGWYREVDGGAARGDDTPGSGVDGSGGAELIPNGTGEVEHHRNDGKNEGIFVSSSPTVSTGVSTVTAGKDDVTAASNEAALCDVVIRRQPLYLWGRYTKLSRSVPQTPWIRGHFSVQEAVSEPFEAFSGCVEGLLHGAGREDVDVRMLGNGRPFSLELVDSRRSLQEIAAQLPALQDAVNVGTGHKNAGGAVSISRLRVAGPGDLPSEVQKVGEGKRKHYRCVVWASRKVGKEELERTLCGRPELVVQQSTPLRVLHRRTLLDRPRSIFGMKVEWINDHFFRLDLGTSAGEHLSTGKN